MAVVVVTEIEFGVVVFRRPLEGLNNAIVRCGDRAEGRVGITKTHLIFSQNRIFFRGFINYISYSGSNIVVISQEKFDYAQSIEKS